MSPMALQSVSMVLAPMRLSGDLMPEVVELILPRLVPVRVPTLRMALAKDGTDYYPARQRRPVFASPFGLVAAIIAISHALLTGT
jgi:hypothetical protein